MRHFLTLNDLTQHECNYLIERGLMLKKRHQAGEVYQPFTGKVLAMIFEKSSTRTRVSFEAGMVQMGGGAIFLSPDDTQLGRGEPVEDTARVISRMVDIIMVRTFEHAKIERFAQHSQVPVINALTNDFHPCQLLADIMTFVEERGCIRGKTITFIGDGNNMCNSYINAARQFGFHLNIACPKGQEPNAALLRSHSNHVSIFHDPIIATKDVDLVVTDTWASMGQEDEKHARRKIFADYQVSPDLMDNAKSGALFMHCLPAYRGEEVSATMLDDPRNIAWEEAGNRLHAQKALMEFLLLGQQADSARS